MILIFLKFKKKIQCLCAPYESKDIIHYNPLLVLVPCYYLLLIAKLSPSQAKAQAKLEG